MVVNIFTLQDTLRERLKIICLFLYKSLVILTAAAHAILDHHSDCASNEGISSSSENGDVINVLIKL